MRVKNVSGCINFCEKMLWLAPRKNTLRKVLYTHIIIFTVEMIEKNDDMYISDH
jgi:hypothetical protein